MPPQKKFKTEAEINFFKNLPVGQVMANVYLPGTILAGPEQIDTVSFDITLKNMDKNTKSALVYRISKKSLF